MQITELINSNLIEFNLDVNDKEEAIRRLADLFEKEGNLISKEDYIKSVLDREELNTTGIGSGIAIPHGKSDSVKETSIAIAKLKSPLEWQSLDDKPVTLIFLLAVKNKDADNLHLKILAQLASMLMEEEFIQKLHASIQASDILNLIEKNI